MTALDFRTEHGDPTTWTTADMETYEHIAETDTLTTIDQTDYQPAA